MFERPLYRLVNLETREVLCYGSEKQDFGGMWGKLQAEGKAVWEDNTPTDDELRNELLSAVRTKRDNLLNDVLWMVERHKQQQELVQNGLMESPSLTTRQYFQLLDYIQKLRDVTSQEDLNNVVFPEKPVL